MLKIQKLVHPTKRSGNLLKPGESTKVRGVTIVNTDGVKGLYVDKWTRPNAKAKKAAVKRRKK